jgi:hypothetical protein
MAKDRKQNNKTSRYYRKKQPGHHKKTRKPGTHYERDGDPK